MGPATIVVQPLTLRRRRASKKEMEKMNFRMISKEWLLQRTWGHLSAPPVVPDYGQMASKCFLSLLYLQVLLTLIQLSECESAVCTGG